MKNSDTYTPVERILLALIAIVAALLIVSVTLAHIGAWAAWEGAESPYSDGRERGGIDENGQEVEQPAPPIAPAVIIERAKARESGGR